MKHIITVEAIGDDFADLAKRMRGLARRVESAMPGYGRMFDPDASGSPWVAEIIGTHPTFRFERRFLKGQKDYSNGNSKGSRGVMLYFVLEEGLIYEISKRASWKNRMRYFFRILDGREEELTEQEVLTCLNTNAASA
jgi:hypothetical protein